jgi:hypothetical protein
LAPRFAAQRASFYVRSQQRRNATMALSRSGPSHLLPHTQIHRLRPLRRLAAVVVAAASAAVVVAASASVAACEPHDVIQIAATVKTAHTATTEKITARASV